MELDNLRSFLICKPSWFQSIQAILFVFIITLLLLVYSINEMFRYKEIQYYIEVDEVTSDVTNFPFLECTKLCAVNA